MSDRTEGKFKFRIKPNIDHNSNFLNRAIEELQDIIVANRLSADFFVKRIEDLEAKVENLEANLKAHKQLLEEKYGESRPNQL